MFALLKNHKLILYFTENENPFSFGKIILIIKKANSHFYVKNHKCIIIFNSLLSNQKSKTKITSSSFKILQELQRNIFF